MRNSTVLADRFTSSDLPQLPENGNRYEIIAGELYVSRQPKFEHQYTGNQLQYVLTHWSQQTGVGLVLPMPGRLCRR